MNITSQLGEPYKILLGDKEYNLTPITQQIRASIEQYYALNHLNLLKEAKKDLSSEEYVSLLNQHYIDLAAGLFDIDGEIGTKYLVQEKWTIHLLWVLLTPHHEISLDEAKTLYLNNKDEAWAALLHLYQKKS